MHVLTTTLVLITRGLYWAMIEAGLALMACCLPTVSALIRHKSVESAIRSVRSRVSLKSGGGSARSARSARSDPSDTELQHLSHNQSRVYGAQGSNDTHVVSGDPPPALPTDAKGIFIRHTVDQESGSNAV